MSDPWAASPGAEYIDGVLSGDIVVCNSIRLAVERAADDHLYGESRGLVFVPDRAQYVLDYARYCRHSKGRWAGQPFEHQPWQAFITSELFGWYRRDTKKRRYRVAFIEVPKKSGKSTYLAVLGIYMLHGDREQGAEVYTIASERNQARIIFSQSRTMVLKSPKLSERILCYKDSLSIEATDSVMMPLPGDPDSIDGVNPSCMLVDEVHRHKSRQIWDLAIHSPEAREQPLILGITTAGDDLTSVCYEQHDYGLKLLEGVFRDDQYFTFIATPDKNYDWTDEQEWLKINPSLGVTKDIQNFRDKVEAARNSPAKSLSFRRFQLNEWTKQVGTWLDMAVWFANDQDYPEERLAGRKCYVGIDIGIVKDMSAVALVFPIDDLWVVLMRYYCPQVSVTERTDLENLPYQMWVETGLLQVTEGNVIDIEYIYEDIMALADQYTIHEIGFDPYRAMQLSNLLASQGVPMVEVPQSNMRLNEAVDALEKQILQHNIVHYGNEILAWNVSNVVLNQNRNKMRAPDRLRSRDKIDGVAAVVNAISRMVADAEIIESSYDEADMPFVINM